mmetsp:Transcript_9066/g.13638  ORF Transcript_9066/g.13638 Transcript_9066/m.13638 type:complete len:282 (+) Transcript_9066:836-1681(+)
MHRRLSHETGTTPGTKSVDLSHLSTAVLLALVQSNKERLATNHLSVHLRHGTCCFLGTGVADESISLVTHNAAAGDGTKRSEQLTELFFSKSLVNILNVQVHALVLVHLFSFGKIHSVLHLTSALRLLLGATHIELEGFGFSVLSFNFNLLTVEFLKGFKSRLVISEINESEFLGFAFLVDSELAACDSAAVLGEGVLQLLLSPRLRKLLAVQIGPVIFVNTILATKERAHNDLLILDHDTVNLLDSFLGSLSSLVVHISISLGVAILISGNFAGQNVTED